MFAMMFFPSPVDYNNVTTLGDPTVREVLQVVSLLLVEHNAKAALQVADQAYVLETGTVALSGSAHELLHNRRLIDTYLGMGGGQTPVSARGRHPCAALAFSAYSSFTLLNS